jgi:hypothetical protein
MHRVHLEGDPGNMSLCRQETYPERRARQGRMSYPLDSSALVFNKKLSRSLFGTSHRAAVSCKR